MTVAEVRRLLSAAACAGLAGVVHAVCVMGALGGKPLIVPLELGGVLTGGIAMEMMEDGGSSRLSSDGKDEELCETDIGLI